MSYTCCDSVNTAFQVWPSSVDRNTPPPSVPFVYDTPHALRYMRLLSSGSRLSPVGPFTPSGSFIFTQLAAPSVDRYSAPSPGPPMLPSSLRLATTRYRVPFFARVSRHANGCL